MRSFAASALQPVAALLHAAEFCMWSPCHPWFQSFFSIEMSMQLGFNFVAKAQKFF